MNQEPSYNASYWRNHLGLEKHVEGGSFRETYRSPLSIPHSVLPEGFSGSRSVNTSIYFLLEHGEFSAFHRIASDEIWHHYDGGIVNVYEIAADGSLTKHLLGKDHAAGALPQLVIPAGSWFASIVEQTDSYALCGCTVSPGFDFLDFELADRKMLAECFPQHGEIIEKLTR